MAEPGFLRPDEYAVLEAVVEHLVPAGDGHPGGREGGAAAYVDGLLAAFTVHPPRIFAGGPFSGRAGGEAGFARFLPLGRLEELAWRTRIEGSRGLPEREFNGPVEGWQARYRAGLATLGPDFPACDHAEREARLAADPDFRDLVYAHACEGLYGAPEYGGNHGASVWSAIGFPGDVQPRGWSDDEVSGGA
jgi:hypothetical protein